MPMPRLLRVALLAVLALAIGCQSQQGPPRPLRTKTYNKVVSLSPGTTEILGSLWEANRVKGRTQADNWPN